MCTGSKGYFLQGKGYVFPPSHAPENNGKLLDQQEEKNDFSGFFSNYLKLPKGNVFRSLCQEFCPQRERCTTPWQADTALAGRHCPGRQTPHLPAGRHPPSRQTPPAGRHPQQADTPPAGIHPRDGILGILVI